MLNPNPSTVCRSSNRLLFHMLNPNPSTVCRSSNRLLFHMLSTTLPVGILAAVEEQCSVVFSRLNQEKDYIILIAAALFDHIFSADDAIRLSATNIFLYLLKERRTCILPLISYPDPSNTASSAPSRVLFPAASSSAPLFSPPPGSTDAQLAEWVVGMAPDVEHLRDSGTLRALVADNARKLRQQVTLGWQKRLMEGSRERYRTRLARLRKRSVGTRPRTHSHNWTEFFSVVNGILGRQLMGIWNVDARPLNWRNASINRGQRLIERE